MEERDAVIVGARCAGSTLAIALAQRGWDVLVVDRDTFPSDTISTHMMFPNTLARFEQLGVLDSLRDGHHLSSLAWRVIGLGRASRMLGRTSATRSRGVSSHRRR
jgi:flavin-dependent dehydrogenase